jgi:hypothetical protein
VTIAYGEKDDPKNVYPNNDGDTNINGQPSLELVRVYTHDGTYTFTAKGKVKGNPKEPEKFGCPGYAEVTFTIGTPGGRQGAISPGLGIAAKPPQVTVDSHSGGIKVPPTTITSVKVESTKVIVGQEFLIEQLGVGDPTNPLCGSDVVLKRVDKVAGPLINYSVEKSSSLWTWSKKQTFAVSQPGTYEVHLNVNSAGGRACGYTGPGTIKGDLTQIEVWDGILK